MLILIACVVILAILNYQEGYISNKAYVTEILFATVMTFIWLIIKF